MTTEPPKCLFCGESHTEGPCKVLSSPVTMYKTENYDPGKASLVLIKLPDLPRLGPRFAVAIFLGEDTTSYEKEIKPLASKAIERQKQLNLLQTPIWGGNQKFRNFLVELHDEEGEYKWSYQKIATWLNDHLDFCLRQYLADLKGRDIGPFGRMFIHDSDGSPPPWVTNPEFDWKKDIPPGWEVIPWKVKADLWRKEVIKILKWRGGGDSIKREIDEAIKNIKAGEPPYKFFSRNRVRELIRYDLKKQAPKSE